MFMSYIYFMLGRMSMPTTYDMTPPDKIAVEFDRGGTHAGPNVSTLYMTLHV